MCWKPALQRIYHNAYTLNELTHMYFFLHWKIWYIHIPFNPVYFPIMVYPTIHSDKSRWKLWLKDVVSPDYKHPTSCWVVKQVVSKWHTITCFQILVYIIAYMPHWYRSLFMSSIDSYLSFLSTQHNVGCLSSDETRSFNYPV